MAGGFVISVQGMVVVGRKEQGENGVARMERLIPEGPNDIDRKKHRPLKPTHVCKTSRNIFGSRPFVEEEYLVRSQLRTLVSKLVRGGIL
jgi:hypothetical protein